jgi:hypothetical protein
MDDPKKHSFIYRNGLTLFFVALTIITLFAQIFTGLKVYNNQQKEHHQSEVSMAQYLNTGHFVETTFENWESEFLQMAMYVIITVKLRQIGSSESKPLEGEEEVDREPKPSPDAPWPVNRGGWVLAVYKNSLSLVFGVLFVMSFVLHFSGSYKNYNEEQVAKGEAQETVSAYMVNAEFWFESFQNWQSEFLSVASIVFLSIYFRQKGSPESKPVDAPFYETGK